MVDATPAPLQIKVSHAGTSYAIELPGTASLQDLRERIQSLTLVPASSQKIVCKGKTLTKEATAASLAELGITDNTKLLVIGSKASALQAFVDEAAALQRRYEVTQSRETGRVRRTADKGKMVMDLNDLRRSGVSAFGQIEVLQGCPHEDLRKERLIRLSKDEAVLDCMQRRDWTVGLLTELHPHRDPTLLGLNKNAGEAVYLRLMTDDLSGLRPYFHTRQVLLHELTHNKHGDHDEAFKTLNSLLNKEVKAFEEAKRAGAHRLGGEIDDVFEVNEETVEQMCGSAHDTQSHTSKPAARAATPRKPATDEDGVYEIEQRRQTMLRAAEERAKKK